MQTPEKPRRTKEVLLAICIIALAIGNVRLHRQLIRVENAISHATLSDWNTASNTQHALWNLSSQIDALNDQIIQSGRPTFDETTHIKAYDSATASATVEISFAMRQHTPGDTVTVTARGENGDTHSGEAHFANGRFTAVLSLPLRDNYALSFAAAGDTVTTGEMPPLHLADMLNRRFAYWLGQGQSWGGNQPVTASLSPSFTNRTQGNPALEVASLSLIIEGEDRSIAAWELTPYLVRNGNEEILDLQESLTLQVGDEPGNIRSNEVVVARLIIVDNLGIRYEQQDQVFIPDRSGNSATPPAPVSVFESRSFISEWGMIRMVD
ncbi:MAG: hypothetical protein FWG38_04010 [Defluviitaleaceae bacterium]|nr:hypothetical protein [Defluviitaleaceae bacterium]